jgi:hypothetical protein
LFASVFLKTFNKKPFLKFHSILYLTFSKNNIMKLPRIVRVPKHQKFKYTPRHYDPKKEDLERRVEMAKGQQGNSPEAAKARIKSQLRRGRNSNPRLRKQLVFKSNMLLLGIIVVLVIGLFIMINVYLPEIMG